MNKPKSRYAEPTVFSVGEKIKIAPGNKAGSSYVVLLINKSTHQVDHVRVNGGQWAEIKPPIGNTCPAGESDDQCVNEQKWVPLAFVSCGQNFSIEIAWPIGGGQWQTAVSNGNYADCNNYSGGVIVLPP